jgi:hypothetical protein
MLHEGNKLHILYCVSEITVPVPLLSVIKLRFRFRCDKKLRLRNTGDETGESDHVNVGRFLRTKMH